MTGKKSKIAVAIVIVVATLIWITISSFNENMQYFVTVKDLAAMPKGELQDNMRVKGFLVPGSIERTPQSLEIFFELEEESETMRVRFDQETPDTFKDGSEVLVEGSFTEQGYFDASTLMAKCPSKYESEEGYNVKDYDPSKYLTDIDGTN